MLLSFRKPDLLFFPGFTKIYAALFAVFRIQVILGVTKWTARLKPGIAPITIDILPGIHPTATGADHLARGCPIGGNNGGFTSITNKRLIGVDNTLYGSPAGGTVQDLEFHIGVVSIR